VEVLSKLAIRHKPEGSSSVGHLANRWTDDDDDDDDDDKDGKDYKTWLKTLKKM
jgi:hypothetical protein